MKNMVITKDKYTMNLAAFRFPPFRKKVLNSLECLANLVSDSLQT